MKKIVALLIILSLFSLVVPPKPAQASGGYSWFLPGLIIGGVIGWGLAAPRYYYPPPYYYYPPRPYYYYPPPYYYYPPPPPPPAPLPEERAQKPPTGTQLFIYPREGQSQEKLEADRNECHSWALGQTGYDPTKTPPDDLDAAQIGQKSLDYQRALGTCLDGRGYTVR